MHCFGRHTSLAKLAIFLAAFLAIAGSAVAQTTQPADALTPKGAASPEWDRIRAGLVKAKPMPDPQKALNPPSATPSGDLLRFDPLTGHTSSVPANKEDAGSTSTQTEEQRPSTVPTSANGGRRSRTPTDILRHSSPLDTSPTPPGPLYYPYTFPWNTEFRLLLRFPVPGHPDQYYLCSASSVSDFHLLSAAHCIYNHDPLENGSGLGAGFAAEIWAWPAETDVVDPIDPINWPDFPYGVAKATDETTYTAWIDSSDLNWDFSFIALDRRIGDHVGWMGRESGISTTALNFDGYPAESPYVPSDNPYQYPGFDAGNVIGYTCCRIQMDAYTYGGHSGGGVWRYDGTNSYIEGVNSTSNRVGYAEATLFTAQTNTDLVNTIAVDKSAHPPTDLAQLIEYVFNGTSKQLIDTSVLPGSSFRLELNAFNAGYNPAGTATAYIYLTQNQADVSSGTYLGALTLGDLDPYTYTIQTQRVAVPTYVQPGRYYVGWVLNGANPEYGTDKNDVIITDQMLTVASPAPTPTATPTATATATSTATATATPTATATATPVPVTLKIKPKALKFPKTTVGTPSKPKTVKVSNPKGNKKHLGFPVLIEMISDPGVFTETNDCPASLAAGTSCSISVKFTPSVVSQQTGTLSITDNANGAIQRVQMSGMGK
jgi:V8-like Glu-specific endopeptidase